MVKLMEDYLIKQKELTELIQMKAKGIATELILESKGKSIKDLRKSTLNYIQQNQLPEGISFALKEIIEQFISNLKIPTQLNG